MKLKPIWRTIISLVVIVLLLVGILVVSLYKNKKPLVTLVTPVAPAEVVVPSSSTEKSIYTDSEGRFSFTYSKEFGNYKVSKYWSNYSAWFGGTYDDFSSSTFGFTVMSKDDAHKDYLASQDEHSTGDYNPYINGEGWEGEKVLVMNGKEGEIPCLTPTQGVYRAVFCQIKKIGANTFLIKYSLDPYKGSSTVKEYITYNKDLRYGFGGGKGLVSISYFKDYPDYNEELLSQGYILGTVENLRKHTPSRNEVLVEDMLNALVFK